MAFQYREGQHTYDELKQTVISEETHSPSLPVPATEEEIPPPVETAAAPECTLEDKISVPLNVDFDLLIGQNPDTVGWVYIEGTHINYPVLQGEDNRHYVSTLFDGSVNQAGSIFMDYRNAGDYSDANTVIYGHNMKNGKMFAVLKKFGNQGFYDAHPEFYIMTPEGNRRYEIISAFQTDALSNIYDRNFVSREAKEKWLNKVLRSSAILSPFTATADDSFVTLSTCVSGDNYRARFVIIGRLAETEPVYAEEIPTVEAGEISEQTEMNGE